ncbi:hypothetical protein RvY_15182 [Ramazzottius varieornatus]|uniref:Uncharacterized protein n=1 Tax=Ramazzottius varieornatus TaxID=947166 RepID=A0A1D1W256_RAMVA|nr:hypothetical protein RvY_15182 [Ramazzottius varieornatus]
MATGRLYCDPDLIRKGDDDKFALQFARIECHYFVNGGFFDEKDQILKDTYKILEHKIPTFVVQGRYDVVCPMKSAWDLYRAMPTMELHVIVDAGHSAKEDGICSKLIHAADQFRKL